MKLLELYEAELAFGLPEDAAIRAATDRYAASRGHDRVNICTGLGTCSTCADLQRAYTGFPLGTGVTTP